MILLPDVQLEKKAAAQLAAWQKLVNEAGNYAAAVEAAKRRFAQCNTPRNRTFRVVRAALTAMCSGARRCCYCEDSCADEVEHVRPKDLYPEVVFVWDNYVYACGPCNGPKNNRFRIFHAETGAIVDVTRRPGDPPLPPPQGHPLLIDPRREDPLRFLELEMSATFYFLPRAGLDPRDRDRALYTIELLHLNGRDLLPKARRNAFGSFRARLVEYREKKRQQKDAVKLQFLIDDLRQMPHLAVWAEMKRQRNSFPELERLFFDVPEALDW